MKKSKILMATESSLSKKFVSLEKKVERLQARNRKKDKELRKMKSNLAFAASHSVVHYFALLELNPNLASYIDKGCKTMTDIFGKDLDGNKV